jgi:hypothetical protein
MNLYLAGRLPDDEIRHVRMRGSSSVRKSKAFGLAAVLLDGRVALEQQGQLAFLKGFALDSFMSFASDGVAEVLPNRGHTPDIAWWRFTFESHCAPSFLLDDAAEVREERNDDFCVHAYVGGFETSLGTFSTLAVKYLGFPCLRWNLHTEAPHHRHDSGVRHVEKLLITHHGRPETNAGLLVPCNNVRMLTPL